MFVFSLPPYAKYNSLHSSFYFQPLQFLYQSFSDCTGHTSYNIAVTFMFHGYYYYYYEFYTPALADGLSLLLGEIYFLS